jgi:excisionase family DNA binding protein
MNNYFDSYPFLLSVDEVANILGVTCKTVRHLVNTGELSGIRVGRLIRIPKDKLIEYLNR